MTTKLFIRRAVTLVTALCMIVCALGCLGFINASADTGFAKLYMTDFYNEEFASGNHFESRYVYVQTDGGYANQQVYVHYKYEDGEAWRDAQAVYFKTLDDGTKLWKADITNFSGSTEYAIKYVRNGVTMWDNNNGNNYTEDVCLGTAPIYATREGFHRSFDAVVQNYGYVKNVVVRYTTDNWATFTDYPLTYNYTNPDGTEHWGHFYISDPDLEYCIYYQVNGQTYWANNFGQNYDSHYCR